MKINFTQAQLDTLTDSGISMEDLKNSVETYKQQGYTEGQIQQGLWGTIKKLNPKALTPLEAEDKAKRTWGRTEEAMRQVGIKGHSFPEDMPYTTRQQKAAKLIEDAVEQRAEARDKTFKKLGGIGAGIDAFGSAFTLGFHDAVKGLSDAVLGTELAQEAKEMREDHPVASITGTVAGYLAPGGAASLVGKSVIKPTTKKIRDYALAHISNKTWGKVAGWAGTVGANAIISQSMFTAQQSAQKIAESQRFSAGMDVLGEFGEGAMFNAAIDTVFGIGGKAFKTMAPYLSREAKAIKALGGAKNIERAQNAKAAVLASGGTERGGTETFLASIMEGLSESDKSRGIFLKLMERSPEFARFVQTQMGGSGRVVKESIQALTDPEYGKVAHELLEALWGKGYTNKFGTSEIDFTKKGLNRLLGLDNASGVLGMRAEGLLNAEKKVAANPSLARHVRDRFFEAKNTLVKNGSRDLESAAAKIERGSIKSYEHSDMFEKAVSEIDQIVTQRAEAALEKGVELSQADVEGIVRNVHRKYAREHFENIMAEGTDSIQDINDIKEFFDAVNPKSVKDGRSAALGAFNVSVNNEILNVVDDTLRMANIAKSSVDDLAEAHSIGQKYTEQEFSSLDALLNSGIDAKEKAVKLAAFKMGILDQLSTHAIEKNTKAFSELRSAITDGRLKKYFSPEEILRYDEIIRPKVLAKNLIDNISDAAKNVGTGEVNVNPQLVRAGASAAMKSPNTFFNAVVTIATKTLAPYGKGVAKMVEEISKTPNWNTFNKYVQGVTDLTDRQMMSRLILMAIQDIAQGE